MVKDCIQLHWDQLPISSHIAGQDVPTEEDESLSMKSSNAILNTARTHGK